MSRAPKSGRASRTSPVRVTRSSMPSAAMLPLDRRALGAAADEDEPGVRDLREQVRHRRHDPLVTLSRSHGSDVSDHEIVRCLPPSRPDGRPLRVAHRLWDEHTVADDADRCPVDALEARHVIGDGLGVGEDDIGPSAGDRVGRPFERAESGLEPAEADSAADQDRNAGERPCHPGDGVSMEEPRVDDVDPFASAESDECDHATCGFQGEQRARCGASVACAHGMDVGAGRDGQIGIRRPVTEQHEADIEPIAREALREQDHLPLCAADGQRGGIQDPQPASGWGSADRVGHPAQDTMATSAPSQPPRPTRRMGRGRRTAATRCAS